MFPLLRVRAAAPLAVTLASSLVLLAGGMPRVAVAQPQDPAPAAPARADEQEAAPKVKVERRGGKKVFRIETSFVIEGRIQKPNAFYVLQRSQINYDWAKLKRDFVPRIFETLKKSPF